MHKEKAHLLLISFTGRQGCFSVLDSHAWNTVKSGTMTSMSSLQKHDAFYNLNMHTYILSKYNYLMDPEQRIVNTI